MSAQTPQQCKNVDASEWMYNDQNQTPCQVLSSSLRLFDTAFNLTWLDLSFSCPHGSNRTNTTTYLSRQLSDYCCSPVSFSLFSSCWACQWDQPVQGCVHTTWGNYSSTCSINSTRDAQILAATQVGTLSSAVQSALTAANIHIPNWAFLPVTRNSTWDELAAKSNATYLVSASTAAEPNQLSPGAIAGISIGSFIAFCALAFIFTVMCMRKKQRHRLEAFRHRSASIFGHKKRVVNTREKTVGARVQQGTARMDLALEDDGLASPVSVKGGLTGAQRVNSDLTMDISHDTTFPALLGGQTRRMETPGSGVGGVPRLERPESGSGVAARFQSNVRRSLARLGRVSQPGRTDPPQSHGLQHTTSNRHTHPMTQMAPSGSNSPFAVPFFSSDQTQSANTSGRPLFQSSQSAPPSAWPTGTFDTSAAHPLTQQQRHPQLSRNPSGPSSALQLSTSKKATPMPLTKEALSLARVAQDGTLFVLGEPELHHGSGKTRGSGGATESRPAHPQQHMVHTVSIERNPAQMQRHADFVPGRSDSLRRSQMQSETQGQGQQQMGLVLHEAIMDGSVPRRKTPSRQRQLEDRGEGPSRQGPSASRTSPAVELGWGTVAASSSQPTASQRQPSSSMGAITAPVARKAVPKSDSSVLANAGSAMGSNGEFSYADEEDESIAALEIRHITGSATGTSGSTNGSSSGNGNGRGGGRGKGKKRGRESHDLRLSMAANTSLSSGNMGGVKSDGTRTPSPKVAPSAEWFDLFRRGTVPTLGGKWPGLGGNSLGLGDGEEKAHLSRTKTAPVPLPESSNTAGVSMSSASGPGKVAAGALSSNQKQKAFQPNALAGPSISTSERNRTQSASNANPAAGLYRTPIAALYSSTSSSSLSALTSTSNAPSGSNTSTVRRQFPAQNTSEPTLAPALTIPATTSGRSTAAVQPPIIRALPLVSPSSAPHHNPTQNLQPVPFPPTSTSFSIQPSLVSNMSQATTATSHSQMQSQRSPPVAPLPPIPPSTPFVLNTLPQPRVAPTGARPPRRLPAIPPQSPPPG